MAAKGRLKGPFVLVTEEREANTLHNKGHFGLPQSGGALQLDLVEALYLVENNRLRVEGHDAASLLRHSAVAEADFELRYIVYRDLRGRTFTVKPSNLTDFNVFPRGAVPGRSASTHLVRCVSERGSLDGAILLDEVRRARRFGKKLLVALVDEEGDLTYYEVTLETLFSSVPSLPVGRFEATFLRDRVLVTASDQAERLFDQGYFGRDVGLGLQLSLPEAVHLVEGGRLRVEDAAGRRQMDAADLADEARRLEPEFDLRHALYRHLRAQGVVPKTGFKYGTHFRAYVGAPEEGHAPYLIHALATGRQVPWQEVSGFVRLAHGVRKRLFFAVPAPGGAFELLELARRKP